MSHEVVLTDQAESDLRSAYAWYRAASVAAANQWYARILDALASLERNPERCPLARENRKVDIELHEYLYGKKPHVFRVIYTIDTDTVRILRIRRAQRRPLSKKQIEAAD